MNQATYKRRIQAGYTHEEATKFTGKEKYHLKVYVDDVFYPNYCSLCRAYEIPRSTFQSRVDGGLSVLEALTLCRFERYNAEGFFVEGVRYGTVIKLAEAYNIKERTLYDRIKAGWSIEKAVGLEGTKNKESRKINKKTKVLPFKNKRRFSTEELAVFEQVKKRIAFIKGISEASKKDKIYLSDSVKKRVLQEQCLLREKLKLLKGEPE